jgi:plasmid stability protein
MHSITIRNVPDETHEELAARAAASGKSLQEYLRAELIAMASKPDIESWLAGVEEQLMASSSRVTTKAVLGHIDAVRGD